jgi:hypothetical protein
LTACSLDTPCVADHRYRCRVEPAEPIVLDLDKAEGEIRQRWFVWTAAGLSVHPVTWADDDDDTAAAPRVRRSDLAAPRSLGLHVFRPGAHVDIVLHADGWAEVSVLRPEADAVVHATTGLESVAAFGELLDRAVELITWSGLPKSQRTVTPDRAARWVLGYDGEGWSNQH